MNYAERGEYGRVPQSDHKSSCCNYLKSFVSCICSKLSCFLFCVLLVLFMVPQNPVWSWGNDRLKDIIQYEASAVTGVKVSVGSVKMGLWNAQTDIYDFTISNPPGYTKTPFFMHCDRIHTDFSWAGYLASFSFFTQVELAVMEGLEVYLESSMGVESNIKKIIDSIVSKPMPEMMEHYFEDKNRKYQIDKIKLASMGVHIRMTAMPVADINTPPMYINGIGVQQNGVPLMDLIGLLVQALSVSALNAEDHEVKVSILKTMQDLKKDTAALPGTEPLGAYINKDSKNDQRRV